MDIQRYALIRSRRKTLALEITRDGRVLVRAPMRTAKREIDAFVSAHGAWIAKRLDEQRRRAAFMPPDPTPDELRAMADKAREIIPPKVEYWSGVTGLRPTGITITAARTRYGSCSGKNRLSFSCFLANYPDAAIDLVVVHELCHIREKNHGSGFYALLSRYLPDHKERKKLLKFPSAGTESQFPRESKSAQESQFPRESKSAQESQFPRESKSAQESQFPRESKSEQKGEDLS